MLQDHYINQHEFDGLCCFSRKIMQNLSITETIYMRCEPSVAHRRIITRGRCAERGISSKYIEQLHNLHDHWLCEPNVIVFNANLQKDSFSYLRECQNYADRLYVMLNYT